jgi:peptidoglycan/xylan/chitin deacetylase (PgdA/CDA1 family)
VRRAQAVPLLFALAAPVACAPRSTGPAPSCVDPSGSPPAAPRSGAIDVAVTVDDLPHHGPDLPGQSPLSIHQAFLAAFRAHHLPPVYGFVVGGQVEARSDTRAALEAWVAAGNPVGNHTHTHPDLRQMSVEAYLADVAANEPLLRDLERGSDESLWKVFRYPFLQEGTDLASRSRIREALLARGYRIAPVTVDFYDWAYNAPYARCLARHDEGAVAALEKSYVADARLFIRWADAAARALFGRPIAQILLLHIGAFDARVVDALLTEYEKLGVRFVSLEQALADPVYATEPKSPRSWEGPLLSQVREARGVDDPPEPNLPDSLLGALCR